MNRSYGSQNVTMDYQGVFHLKCESSNTPAKSALSTVKNTAPHVVDLSINKAFVSNASLSILPVHIAIVVLLTTATVAVSRRQRAGYDDDELEEFVPSSNFARMELAKFQAKRTAMTLATSATAAAADSSSTKALKTMTLVKMAPEATPIRRFSWPMHLPLDNVSNFSDQEIEKIGNCNSPQPSPKMTSSKNSSKKKKKLQWSPCVEVIEVMKLGKNACLEWDDESDSLWYDPVSATGSKGPPELVFQKYRLRRRLYQ